MKSVCVVCGEHITWQFSICNECEKEYGKRSGDWPEWLRFLVNDIRRERRADMRDWKEDEKTGLTKLTYLAYADDTGRKNMSYTIDYDELLWYKMWYTGYVLDTDGTLIQDSDWEAVYSYSL